ncbi:hypothetical protein HMPREF0682_2710 [Propionibacterium acidifaciens F0233]|uniref:Uncharacterized protein n=2 Tax=Propionibacterium acidifaciens TaxID=556499 RepID=U2PVT5_9ACTN|nr:hypothetical protein HMPREF0682_2710 [Propionibacterium acidifaciens F0233]
MRHSSIDEGVEWSGNDGANAEWLAVPLAVMFSLPFGLWLGDYDLPLRVAFVVWGECFVFGGKLAGLRQLIPAFTIGALAAGIVQSFAMALADPFGTAELVTAGDLAVAVAYSAGFGIAVHIMRFVRVLRDGTPACFQGIAITLACIFTGQGPATSDLGQPLRPSLRRRDRVGPVMPAGLGRRLGQRGAERAA